MSHCFVNTFRRIIKLNNNAISIPKYKDYDITMYTFNVDAFIFPSYLPNTCNIILNSNKNNNNIYIQYKYNDKYMDKKIE